MAHISLERDLTTKFFKPAMNSEQDIFQALQFLVHEH